SILLFNSLFNFFTLKYFILPIKIVIRLPNITENKIIKINGVAARKNIQSTSTELTFATEKMEIIIIKIIAKIKYVCPFIFHHSTSDRKSTRLNSSHVSISYAVFCLKKKK